MLPTYQAGDPLVLLLVRVGVRIEVVVEWGLYIGADFGFDGLVDQIVDLVEIVRPVVDQIVVANVGGAVVVHRIAVDIAAVHHHYAAAVI